MEIYDGDHVSRYCSPLKVGKDDRPLPAAFDIGASEEYLSVNWIEYFKMPSLDKGMKMVEDKLSKNYTIKEKGLFAVFNIGDAKAVINQYSETAARIEHIPEPNNESHAGIYGYTSNDLDVTTALSRKYMRVYKPTVRSSS